MSSQKILYKGVLQVKCAQPSLTILPLATSNNSEGLLGKISEASKRRLFHLNSDWEIEVSGIDYKPELNGKIIIPQEKHKSLVKFDGASAPFAWLASFLSLGIVRPMGIMFNASIVHDFCYEYGYLEVETHSTEVDTHSTEVETPTKTKQKVTVSRAQADRLFRDIISTIHGMPIAAWMCWCLVRMGWCLGVNYHGRPNYRSMSILGIISVPFLVFTIFHSGVPFKVDSLYKVIGITFITLFLFYVITPTLISLKKFIKRKKSALKA